MNKKAKMDPSELRMNLASLQRIDPFIKGIIMSSPQVSFDFTPMKYLKVTNISNECEMYDDTIFQKNS